MPPTGSAPTFDVPPREIVALEHPMIINNVDNGLKTLGSGIPLQQLLNADGYEGCFPLYLRTVDPTCAPLLSNNTPSSNVLLKITVPKRTGRKRKRGSDDPYTPDSVQPSRGEAQESVDDGQSTSLRSHSRLDSPKYLLRSLRDNVGKYKIEPIGSIDQTHRYRGMTDFHYSTTHGKFMTKFRETILPGNVESLRKFKLDPSRGVKQNDEIIPPPTMSDKTIPINWGYHQNSSIKITTDGNTGETVLTNQSRPQKILTYYVPFDTPTVPISPPPLPPPDLILQSLLNELSIALSERPIWSRRAMMNRIPRSNPGMYLLKPAIQYVGYQFRGGPWRDAIVRYGIDPRASPEYRIYQTLFFKIIDDEPAPDSTAGAAAPGKQWHDKRSEYTRKANPSAMSPTSHVFDGTSISLDGKIWQVCDITDPLLVRLLSTPNLRDTCDVHSDGWYCNGTWAKVRAVMRAKISAIRLGRQLLDSDFNQTLQLPDVVKTKARVTAHMPYLGGARSTLALAATVDDDGDAADEDEATYADDAHSIGGDPGHTRLYLDDRVNTKRSAWRRRKMMGIKKRNQKEGIGRGNLRLGRARRRSTAVRASTANSEASGPRTEAMGAQDLTRGADGTISLNRDVTLHATVAAAAAMGVENLDEPLGSEGHQGSYSEEDGEVDEEEEGDEDEDEDEIEDEEADEDGDQGDEDGSEEGEGGSEDIDEDEEEEGDEDDDVELDSEGW